MAANPLKQEGNIVKRVLYVEGELVEFEKLGEKHQLRIPKGHIWVEGDNKEFSRDSRDYGPLPLSLVKGIVRYRIWPLDKINKI